MEINRLLNRRFIVITLLSVFVVTPILAFATTSILAVTYPQSPVDTPPKRTKEELSEVISRDRLSLDESERYPDVEIDKFERIENKWYLIYVKTPNSSTLKTMVLGDFYNDSKKIRVILQPGQQLIGHNISNIGLPYEIVDKVNDYEMEEN